MAYVYKFINKYDECIYVGYTGQTMDARIGQHFSDKGHLDKECYDSICKIEYKKYRSKCDAQVMEVYYINQLKPKFNKLNKKNDVLTIKIDDNQKWRTYRTIKEAKEYKLNPLSDLLKWGILAYIIYIILKTFTIL